MLLSLQFSELQHIYNRKKKNVPDSNTLVFGATMTDHILEMHWTKSRGWGRPTIDEYHPISLDPAAKCFHYAVEVGMIKLSMCITYFLHLY